MQTDRDLAGLQHAIAEARIGRDEGGVPIGRAPIADDGTVLGLGQNRRVQQNSAIRHGETDALENRPDERDIAAHPEIWNEDIGEG